MKGLFIVFEGVEGSGKTTQARLIGEWLAGRGIAHVVTREPGGTGVGEAVRELLLHGEHMPARAELMLYLAARAALVAERIVPSVKRGDVVVADRYELSTFAYQGAGRGLPIEAVRAANAAATGGLSPDLTVLVEVPAAVAEARLAVRVADRIERAGREFHDRVAAAYRALRSSEARVEAVDGTSDPETVHSAVLRLLGRRFPETFAVDMVK